MNRATVAAVFAVWLAFACKDPTPPKPVPTPPAPPPAKAPPINDVKSAPSPAAGDDASLDASHAVCSVVSRWLAYPPMSPYECDAARCKAAGGMCGYGGMGCPVTCIRRTRDGGKPCSDAKDCESGCFTEPNVPAKTEVRGTCHPAAVVLGCNNPVAAGRALGAICAD